MIGIPERTFFAFILLVSSCLVTTYFLYLTAMITPTIAAMTTVGTTTAAEIAPLLNVQLYTNDFSKSSALSTDQILSPYRNHKFYALFLASSSQARYIN